VFPLRVGLRAHLGLDTLARRPGGVDGPGDVVRERPLDDRQRLILEGPLGPATEGGEGRVGLFDRDAVRTVREVGDRVGERPEQFGEPAAVAAGRLLCRPQVGDVPDARDDAVPVWPLEPGGPYTDREPAAVVGQQFGLDGGPVGATGNVGRGVRVGHDRRNLPADQRLAVLAEFVRERRGGQRDPAVPVQREQLVLGGLDDGLVPLEFLLAGDRLEGRGGGLGEQFDEPQVVVAEPVVVARAETQRVPVPDGDVPAGVQPAAVPAVVDPAEVLPDDQPVLAEGRPHWLLADAVDRSVVHHPVDGLGGRDRDEGIRLGVVVTERRELEPEDVGHGLDHQVGHRRRRRRGHHVLGRLEDAAQHLLAAALPADIPERPHGADELAVLHRPERHPIGTGYPLAVVRDQFDVELHDGRVLAGVAPPEQVRQCLLGLRDRLIVLDDVDRRPQQLLAVVPRHLTERVVDEREPPLVVQEVDRVADGLDEVLVLRFLGLPLLALRDLTHVHRQPGRRRVGGHIEPLARAGDLDPGRREFAVPKRDLEHRPELSNHVRRQVVPNGVPGDVVVGPREDRRHLLVQVGDPELLVERQHAVADPLERLRGRRAGPVPTVVRSAVRVVSQLHGQYLPAVVGRPVEHVRDATLRPGGRDVGVRRDPDRRLLGQLCRNRRLGNRVREHEGESIVRYPVGVGQRSLVGEGHRRRLFETAPQPVAARPLPVTVAGDYLGLCRPRCELPAGHHAV